MISKKALVIGLVGLVFVAGGTASVLESFGTISGTASVDEPVFYAQPDTSLMTEATSDGNQQIYDGDGPSFVYESDATWYPMEVDFDVEVRDDTSDDNKLDGKVNATFSVGDKSCEKQFTVSDNQEEYMIKEFSCSIDEAGTGNLKLHLEQIQGKSYLNYDESTFVEVSAK